MARRTFFSFHYRHVWKVNQIRSMPNVIGTAAAGFQDASLWERTKLQGSAAIERLINSGLKNTTVTVVCITHGASTRRYINYEIDKSLDRGNGLLALKIHNLRDQYKNIGSPGTVPNKILDNGFKAYNYTNQQALARWIEEAARIAGR